MDNVRIIIYCEPSQIEQRGGNLGNWDNKGITQNVADVLKTGEFPRSFYQWTTTNGQVWEWDIRWNWTANEKKLFGKYNTPFVVFVNATGVGSGEVYAILNRENANKAAIKETLRGVQAAKREAEGVYSVTLPDGKKALLGDPLDQFTAAKKEELKREYGAGSFDVANGKSWGLSIPIFPRLKFPKLCNFLDTIGLGWACSLLAYWWVLPVVAAAYYVWKDNHDNEAARRIVTKALSRT